MSAIAAFPGLSQLLAWPTEHLSQAADYWEAMGGRCYGLANQVWQDALSIDWQGEAADRLRTVTHSDMLTTSTVADQLHEAAKVARSGASDLYVVRSRVRYAVEDTRTAGFGVGEDLSVTDRASGGSPVQRAARQAQAQTFAGNIRQRAAELVGLDQQVAGKVTAAVAGIRHTFPQNPSFGPPPKDNRVQAVDNRTFKQDPSPQPPPYPINEVIAEATDLDGNSVLLRRGYYDASSGKGFGWDKAYWRHGVVNINVFKDLISHSRPVRKEGAVLTYEVPINRTHCTRGLFGFPNCQDTGESLTMVIKVDNSEGRPDVPDGLQKGVITMFPLKGGSGVVELGPRWTWTPPWVNNNVPIN
jgi:hypothetical protein